MNNPELITSPRTQVLIRFLEKDTDCAATLFMTASAKELASLCRAIPSSNAALALKYVPNSTLLQLMGELEEDVATCLINDLPTNFSAPIIRNWLHGSEAARQKSKRILENISAKSTKAIKSLLSYPKGSLGSIMDPFPISVRFNINIGQARSIIEPHKDNCGNNIYVTDANHKLVGELSFKQMFYANKEIVVADLMEVKITSLNVMAPLSVVFEKHEYSGWSSLPLIDSERRLVGVVHKKQLENYTFCTISHPYEDDSIAKASAALGEIIEIGFTATFTVLGFEPRS